MRLDAEHLDFGEIGLVEGSLFARLQGSNGANYFSRRFRHFCILVLVVAVRLFFVCRFFENIVLVLGKSV